MKKILLIFLTCTAFLSCSKEQQARNNLSKGREGVYTKTVTNYSTGTQVDTSYTTRISITYEDKETIRVQLPDATVYSLTEQSSNSDSIVYQYLYPYYATIRSELIYDLNRDHITYTINVSCYQAPCIMTEYRFESN